MKKIFKLLFLVVLVMLCVKYLPDIIEKDDSTENIIVDNIPNNPGEPNEPDVEIDYSSYKLKFGTGWGPDNWTTEMSYKEGSVFECYFEFGSGVPYGIASLCVFNPTNHSWEYTPYPIVNYENNSGKEITLYSGTQDSGFVFERNNTYYVTYDIENELYTFELFSESLLSSAELYYSDDPSYVSYLLAGQSVSNGHIKQVIEVEKAIYEVKLFIDKRIYNSDKGNYSPVPVDKAYKISSDELRIISHTNYIRIAADSPGYYNILPGKYFIDVDLINKVLNIYDYSQVLQDGILNVEVNISRNGSSTLLSDVMIYDESVDLLYYDFEIDSEYADSSLYLVAELDFEGNIYSCSVFPGKWRLIYNHDTDYFDIISNDLNAYMVSNGESLPYDSVNCCYVHYLDLNYIQPYDFYLYSDLDYFGYSNISLGSEFVSPYEGSQHDGFSFLETGCYKLVFNPLSKEIEISLLDSSVVPYEYHLFYDSGYLGSPDKLYFYFDSSRLEETGYDNVEFYFDLYGDSILYINDFVVYDECNFIKSINHDNTLSVNEINCYIIVDFENKIIKFYDYERCLFLGLLEYSMNMYLYYPKTKVPLTLSGKVLSAEFEVSSSDVGSIAFYFSECFYNQTSYSYYIRFADEGYPTLEIGTYSFTYNLEDGTYDLIKLN